MLNQLHRKTLFINKKSCALLLVLLLTFSITANAFTAVSSSLQSSPAKSIKDTNSKFISLSTVDYEESIELVEIDLDDSFSDFLCVENSSKIFSSDKQSIETTGNSFLSIKLECKPLYLLYCKWKSYLGN